VALLPLALALVGTAVGLAVAPDVRAGRLVGGVTATAVGIATIVAAALLFSRRREP